jgi:hypothetical protein
MMNATRSSRGTVGECRTLARCASVVGQTSGQCVYPKNTTTGCPRSPDSVNGRASWSMSAKSGATISFGPKDRQRAAIGIALNATSSAMKPSVIALTREPCFFTGSMVMARPAFGFHPTQTSLAPMFARGFVAAGRHTRRGRGPERDKRYEELWVNRAQRLVCQRLIEQKYLADCRCATCSRVASVYDLSSRNADSRCRSAAKKPSLWLIFANGCVVLSVTRTRGWLDLA